MNARKKLRKCFNSLVVIKVNKMHISVYNKNIMSNVNAAVTQTDIDQGSGQNFEKF